MVPGLVELRYQSWKGLEDHICLQGSNCKARPYSLYYLSDTSYYYYLYFTISFLFLSSSLDSVGSLLSFLSSQSCHRMQLNLLPPLHVRAEVGVIHGLPGSALLPQRTAPAFLRSGWSWMVYCSLEQATSCSLYYKPHLLLLSKCVFCGAMNHACPPCGPSSYWI